MAKKKNEVLEEVSLPVDADNESNWNKLEKLVDKINTSKQSTVKIEAPGLITLLTVLFIGLKLTGHIAWSWWWVLAPLWTPVVFVLGIVIFALIAAVIITKYSD